MHSSRFNPLLKAALLGLVAITLAPGLGAAPFDLANATIADVEAAMANGSLTSVALTEAYLARIAAYDQQGPALNAVIALNPKALETAKALDAERKAGKIRGPLHGIPVVLKDNYNTFDLPTTAGSQLLQGSIPPADAFVVKKLRDAGAIILAKVNLSEFAGGGGGGGSGGAGGYSSMGGQTRNPHDPTRGVTGSSGGTGAAIAAVFAQFGMGTDTGGSIRHPTSVNGIVGLKPTWGLLSRSGIVPLALSFDTGGPMARSVTDIAIALGVMTGVDPTDAATKGSAGNFKKDYTAYLKRGSLKGARIGVERDFFGQNAGTDQVMETAIAKLKELGATVVDPIHYPEYFLQAKQALSPLIMNAEFKAQIAVYLATLKPGFPRTLSELVAKAEDPATGYRSPSKRDGLKKIDETALSLTDPVYLAAHDEGLKLIRATVLAEFAKYNLDALVYPTSSEPAETIQPPDTPAPPRVSGRNLANETGFPDLIVPAGMTSEGLPVTISFVGKAFSEPKLLAYGYDFEQATMARVLPKYTPLLP